MEVRVAPPVPSRTGAVSKQKNSMVFPGRVLYDTNGKRVQAHGGSLFYENNTYYFYGENKEKTTGKNKIWTWGVRCYSSKDFYNWKDEGLIIPPNLSDKKSLLYPTHFLDRPHIVRSPKTGQYVCWLKFSAKKESCFAVMTSENFRGPYRMIKSYFQPYGLEVGDFDILQSADGCYLYFSNGRTGVAACRLTDDCTDVQGNYKMYYTGLTVPYCREGIAVFEQNNRVYMFTSGMTGYVPNASQVAELNAPLGELTDLGSPYIDDPSGVSFHSQISSVFRHPDHANVFIALADRWIPSLHFTKEESKRKMRAIAACCSRQYHAGLAEILSLAKLPLNCKKVNTSISDYVWLPVKMNGGKPEIAWHNAWSLEELISETSPLSQQQNNQNKEKGES